MGKVVAITGASSGIGEQLAYAWADRRGTIFLNGRNQVALDRVAAEVERRGGRPHVQAGDVTLAADREKLIERVRSVSGHLDVLVNNAGRGYYGSIQQVQAAELDALFQLNVIAPVALTQLALDELKWSKGTVVMMSSIPGVAAAPRMGAYCASKFALEAVASSLRAELSQCGVHVVVVRPGPVDTPFRQNAARSEEAGYPFKRGSGQSAKHVAELTVRAVERGHDVVETSLLVRAASFFARTSPALFRRAMVQLAGRSTS